MGLVTSFINKVILCWRFGGFHIKSPLCKGHINCSCNFGDLSSACNQMQLIVSQDKSPPAQYRQRTVTLALCSRVVSSFGLFWSVPPCQLIFISLQFMQQSLNALPVATSDRRAEEPLQVSSGLPSLMGRWGVKDKEIQDPSTSPLRAHYSPIGLPIEECL